MEKESNFKGEVVSDEDLKEKALMAPVKGLAEISVQQAASGRFCLFQWTEDWEPDHRHWRGPTWLEIYNNGRIVAAASYIANMKRTNPIFNGGVPAWFSILFELLENGTVIYSGGIGVRQVSYKQEVYNAAAEKHLPGLGSFLERTTDVRAWRYISPQSGGPGDVIPFPPIPWG
ncbi:hypothetical protein [Cupriavidus pinatubonensis]|uniref:Uncharacterized protein n=1 Tax=Cupriavidus pinatubonensis TaxID=248026 RepID=A0ABN7ZE04_9BURK|nr:hypothetical protein [Cupriavidus pinatubonensis]CAG9183889.1 hypothetical protein LMG23994_05256 [Cupriavidus pinatubonensis]